LFVVGPELPGKTEVRVAEVVVARIFGPHAGEDLGHGAKVLLHGPLANRPAVGGKMACPDFVCEHLEEGNGVLYAGEGGIEAEVGTETGPLPPIGAVGCRLARMDASGNLVLAKMVDNPACCAGVKWSIVQDSS
jgi:hypothetical protein